MIPEETKVAIVEVTEDEYKELAPAHNSCVNTDANQEETDAVMKIDAAFYHGDNVEGMDTKWVGRFTDQTNTSDITEVANFINARFYL